jgi:hypothetical protein
MLAVLRRRRDRTMHVEALRIVDFFVCFPARLTEIRPPNSVPGMRKKRNAVVRALHAKEYELLPSSHVLYDRMEVIQEAAISAMAAKGLAQMSGPRALRAVRLQDEAISKELQTELDKFTDANSALLELLATDFPQVPLSGTDGLKARTGLGEYEYDVV